MKRKTKKHQSTQVSQEELAKTQVLNLSDVQEIANFEKKTSKRPAALFALAGVLAITLGFSYPNIMTAIDAIPSKTKIDQVEAIYNDNILTNIPLNQIKCDFTSTQNTDSISSSVSYKFIFDNEDKLQRYTMTLELEALPGNTLGTTAVENYFNQYKSLDAITLNGYNTVTTYTGTNMKTIASVDLTKLDKTTLTPNHTSLGFTSVTDNLNDQKDIIIQKYSLSGYICQ